MKTCEHCGGLIATEDGERIAGTLCRCGFAAVTGSAVEGASPCPFCAGSDIYWSDCRNHVTCPQDRGWRRIVCRTCGSGTTTYPPDSHQDCLTRWNTRILTQNAIVSQSAADDSQKHN